MPFHLWKPTLENNLNAQTNNLVERLLALPGVFRDDEDGDDEPGRFKLKIRDEAALRAAWRLLRETRKTHPEVQIDIDRDTKNPTGYVVCLEIMP